EAREIPAHLLPPGYSLDDLRHGTSGPKCVHPWTEGEDLLAFVRTAEQHATALGHAGRRELLDEPTLADAGLSGHEHDVPAPAARGAKSPSETIQLRLASDQRRLRCGHRRARGRRRAESCRTPARWRRPLQDLEVEPLRLGLGLDAELLLLHGHARLVLPQRRCATALARVEPHERPVYIFLKRIERDEARGGVGSQLDASGPDVAREHAAKGIESQVVQSRALGIEPR